MMRVLSSSAVAPRTIGRSVAEVVRCSKWLGDVKVNNGVHVCCVLPRLQLAARLQGGSGRRVVLLLAGKGRQ